MFDSEKGKLSQYEHLKGAYIAGGALTSLFTNQPVNDVDVYFKSREDFVEAIRTIYDDFGWWCLCVSKRAVTFVKNGDVYQMMYFDFFPKPEDIFKAFDFTVCMAAYDMDTKEIVTHDDFLKHNSQRFLSFNQGTRYPIASALRAMKYMKRGYTIGNGEFLKIVLASRLPEILNWEQLKDQIGGAYGDKVLLKGEGKEFSIPASIESLDSENVWTRSVGENVATCAETLFEKVGYLEEAEKEKGGVFA